VVYPTILIEPKIKAKKGCSCGWSRKTRIEPKYKRDFKTILKNLKNGLKSRKIHFQVRQK